MTDPQPAADVPWEQDIGRPTAAPRRYAGPVRYVNAGTGHSFRDANNLRVPGVTSITKNLPSDNLIGWAVGATADYAVDNWDALTAAPVSERMKQLRAARWSSTAEARVRGTKLHKLAEKLAHGDEVPIPAGWEGYIRAIVSFLDDHEVEPVMSEFAVMSHRYGYAGFVDLVADVTDEAGFRSRWLLDWKIKPRAWYDAALQLAAYRFADVYTDPETGLEVDMIGVDRCGVVLIQPDRYELVPVQAEEQQLAVVLALQTVSEFVDTGRDLLGDPLDAPHLSRFVLSQVEEGK